MKKYLKSTSDWSPILVVDIVDLIWDFKEESARFLDCHITAKNEKQYLQLSTSDWSPILVVEIMDLICVFIDTIPEVFMETISTVVHLRLASNTCCRLYLCFHRRVGIFFFRMSDDSETCEQYLKLSTSDWSPILVVDIMDFIWVFIQLSVLFMNCHLTATQTVPYLKLSTSDWSPILVVDIMDLIWVFMESSALFMNWLSDMNFRRNPMIVIVRETICRKKEWITEFWEVSIEHLRRVWHADRGRLLFRTPDPVPFGTCIGWFVLFLHMFYLLRPILLTNLSLFFRTMLFE